MKRVGIFLASVSAAVLMFCAISFNNTVSASEFKDLLMEEFFPNGIENYVPNDPVYDLVNFEKKDQGVLDVYIRQNEDILRMTRENVSLLDSYTQSEEYNDFDMKYRLEGFDVGVQFDISVDGGDWLYVPETWDTCEMWDQENIPTGLPVKEYFGWGYKDNFAYMAFLRVNDMNNNPGVMEGIFESNDDVDVIDLKNHTINTRYRYFVEYTPWDDINEDGELVGHRFMWTAWSNEVSVGKKGNAKDFKLPKNFPAPTLSDPYFNADGQLYCSVDFSTDLTDTEIALNINNEGFEVLNYLTEICLDDPSEENFEEAYTANPVWMSWGDRIMDFTNEEINKKSRILIRGSVICEMLDKATDYGYAVPSVTKLKAKSIKKNSMKLTWGKAEDAEFYEIYDSNNKLIGTTKKTNYTIKKLKAGTDYSFKVRAVKNGVFVGKFTSVKAKTKK